MLEYLVTEQVEKRIKTYLWDVSYVAAVAGLDYASEHIIDLGLPVWAIPLVGLAISQVSKYIYKVRNKND